MKFPGAKRRPPFVTLPRHKRSHEVIRLKGKMRRDAAEYGGRSTSRLVLNEPGRPDLYNQWFDFYFPGTDRFTSWNASFVTARKAFWDKAHDIAHTRVAEMLTPEEREQNSKLEFVPAQRSSTGKILTYKLAEREKMRFAQFGGLTFHEQWRKLESEIARNEPPVIHESFKLDRSYVYGIGLKIVLDVDVINQASIEAAIDRFIELGETDWVSLEPVPRDRLAALEAAGLVKGEDTEVDIMGIMGKPTGGKAKIKRYTMTDAAKPFAQEKEVASIGHNGKTTEKQTDLCWGKKALDKIVKWEGPMKFGDYQEAGITYTYKVNNLADWAKKPEVQAAFPVVKSILDGAGSKESKHAVKLTSQGWEAKGLD